MRLRAIRVNQWRRFTRPAGIEGLADGLNVLVAPNEAGKSTLVEALRMALFTKHGTGGRDVEALLNHDAPNAPVVEVEFEVDGRSYILRKRFSRGKQARLVKPDGAELQGEGAEAFLAELLGFTFPGRGPGTAQTMGLWSLLWLEQGTGAEPISAPDAAQRTILGALEDTVGDLLGGEQGRRLSLRVRGALKELVTEAQGQPRGGYREAIERADRLARVHADLAAALARTEADREAYERVCAELREREAAGNEADLVRAVDAASERLEALLTLEAEVAAAQSEAQRLGERLVDAQQSLGARATLIAAIDDLRAAIARDRQAVAVDTDEEARLAALWQAARAAQARAEAMRVASDEALRQAERTLSAAQLARALDRLEATLARAEETAATMASLSARIDANGATRQAMGVLEERLDGARAARAAMTAVATLVDFELEAGAASRVTLSTGDVPVAGDSLELLDPIEIHVAGVGTIRVRPQVGEAGTLQAALAHAERDLAAALTKVGAADPAMARQLARDRDMAERELRDAASELERLAPSADGGLDGLRERRDRSRGELQQLASDGLDLAGLPAVDAARAAQATAARAALEAAHAAARALQAVADHRAALDDHRDALRGPLAALAEAEAQLRAKAGDLEALPDEATLQKGVAAAQAACLAQEAVVGELRSRAAGETVALARARRDRLQQSLASWRDSINSLKTTKAGLQTSLARDGAGGLGEKVAAAERELELATMERDRLAREAEILGMLNRALGEAEREARERFLGPITDKVRPYLQLLFPAADLALDESLGIASVRRGPRETPVFDALSMGTREQINLLTRIAIAELMVEQGKPAMVIIDDGLAHADDRRLERMFDILALASEKVQILVLSCHARAFERAGGTLLSIREFDETEGLASA